MDRRGTHVESIDCSVCHQPFPAAEIKRIGARDFCAPHYARATRMVHTRLSRSGLIEVAVAGAFVGAVWIGFGGSGSGTLPTSVGMGLLLALVPALIWATYVMRQDRIAPEPWGYVLGVFLLGGLLAHAVVQPLANGVFHVDQWGRRSAVAKRSRNGLSASPGRLRQEVTPAAKGRERMSPSRSMKGA